MISAARVVRRCHSAWPRRRSAKSTTSTAAASAATIAFAVSTARREPGPAMSSANHANRNATTARPIAAAED